MKLLGFDASSTNLSLAIMDKDKLVHELNRKTRFAASDLITYIKKACESASLKLADFDAFVVGRGPGSFTGLRISYSIIKALAYSTKKPIITIGSFWACAFSFAGSKKKVAVISDARRNLIYFASFKCKNKKVQAQVKEKLVTLKDLPKNDYFFITYDGHLRKQVLEERGIMIYPKDVYPKASNLLILAQDKYRKGDFTSLDKLEPLYIHPKTCQIRKKK
jgi:tRNA threonylcarbamoyladenosine biosynthesis protein TsaB